MTRPRWLGPIVTAAFIMGAGRVQAQLPEPWRNWRYVAPIEIGQTDEPRLVAVTVPNEVTAEAAPGWTDLRVIDGAGREVPSLLDAREPRGRQDWREARLLDSGVVTGEYVQVVLDLGDDPPVHNAVDFSLSGRDDVQASLQIDLSDDGRTWRSVEERVPIFRLREAGRGERTDATYPPSRSRYLRLRLHDATAPLTVDSARVAYEAATPAERRPAGIVLSLAPSEGQSTETVWMSESQAKVPVSEIRFQTSASALSRRVVVEVARQRDRWLPVASGEIRRTPASPDRPLSIAFAEASGRWRVTVANGNDGPIVDLTPTLYTTIRRVVFRQEPGEAYRLIYGHARPEAPSYDFARLTRPEAIDAAMPARLGAVVLNTAWVDATPWSERHPAIVWVAIVLAVLFVGALALKTLRTGVS